MNLDHLALVVRNQQRSRDFYEAFFGFGKGPASRYEDGTVIVRNDEGFALALHPSDDVPPWDDFSHFGFSVADAGEVREMQRRIEASGFRIVEETTEPGYVSFKFLDPDGYKVEVSWEVFSAQ